ncbi:MAG: ABC transporter permease [Methylobacteriaceae bacterium]|nr:ABC transporter permease [Methylobacteriaceae bacterium]
MNQHAPWLDLGIRAGFMVAVYCIFAAQIPNYYSLNGLAALLDGAVLTGVIAAGIGTTMLAGEFDLSVGSMAAVAGVVTIKIFGLGVLPAIAAATAIAGVLGALQGLLIGSLGINSLVFTIGTLIALRGIALILSGENTVTVPIEQLSDIDVLTERVLGVFSPLSGVLVAVFVTVGLLLRFTRFGREIYAIGGGRNEARAAGVPILRPMIIAFALSGTLAGLGGALLSVRSGSASPLAFDTVLLSAATTCLIGGIALQGGRGNIIGIAIGLFTLRFFVAGVASLGAPYWLQNLATGALLILVIATQLVPAVLGGRRVRSRPSPAPAQP